MKPNLVLVTIDTLRFDHCSDNGYMRKTTPFLDKIGKKGISLKYSFANGPLTPRSFPSILCGVGPFYRKEENLRSYFLPKNVTSISERLKQKGYQTIAFQAANPFISRFYGYDRGFDEFYDNILDSEIDVQKESNESKIKDLIINFIKKHNSLDRFARKFKSYYEFINKFKKIKDEDLPFVRGGKLNEDINQWLKKDNSTKPKFIWVHYMDVHQPHLPKKWAMEKLNVNGISNFNLAKYWSEIDNRTVKNEKQLEDMRNLYDCEILYEDECIKELFAIFAEHGINESNTTFLITSDHGEEFGEHGGLGHELKLYNEMLHVPFFAYGFKAELLESLKGQILELKDIPYLLEKIIEEGDDINLDNKYAISESFRKDYNKNEYYRVFSIQDEQFKLIWDPRFDEKSELFNLKKDEKEQNNIINKEEFSPIKNKMENAIKKYINERSENTEKRLIKNAIQNLRV